MNERDTEIASVVYGSQWTMQDMEFAALIRADAMEAATRAANESWTLMCKKMVEFEREACAKVCDDYGKSLNNEWNKNLGVADDLRETAEECAEAIRARGNT